MPSGLYYCEAVGMFVVYNSLPVSVYYTTLTVPVLFVLCPVNTVSHVYITSLLLPIHRSCLY